MQFDLVRLNNNIEKTIPINLTYSFNKSELSGTDLLELNDVKLNGEIFKNSLGNVELNICVFGTMVIPCAITLKPVNYPFETVISGELQELLNQSEENNTNFTNTIDILPIIWENILMEIPMRVVSDEVKDKDMSIEGNGWKFTTDDVETSTPLSELMDMIDDSEVK